MTEIAKNYDPLNIEKKWYDSWMAADCFKPKAGKQGESFCLLMPPPNVTGKLHMGHALDHSCQDALVRFKRMKGFETLWIPGYDHAGISCQAVVEKLVYKEEKKTKYDLGREEFLKRIWQWKEEYGGTIVDQIKMIGDSCDWSYFTFTLDAGPNHGVRKYFVDLYNRGLIYQADYIVNWDPTLQSAISDAEVEHKEVQGKFYHIFYAVKDSDTKLEIATTRPETLYGDTAVAVNPEDERFNHLIGKRAIVPFVDREVPIIADEHVDIEKGTGCLKVTPGHDFNDFEIGKRNNLEIVNILNKDGTLNEVATPVAGMDILSARNKTVELLEEKGILGEVKDHVHQVGHGERSDEIVEPMVTKQWFLNVQEMAKTAVEAVENDQMKFVPKEWENTYFAWLREPRNWCISRQLWWGHQIPVYYCGDCQHTFASVEEPDKCTNCESQKITQDPDVLDTWFSSGLWPLTTLGWPDQEKMKEKGFEKFYPTQTMVTGFDIIFFWVARMMMMGMDITGKTPFDHTYIHGIVRDKQGRKMSKSLGNGIDPIDIIGQYGADAMRFTLLSGAGHNRGLNLDPERIEGYRNFINKVWNAFRFIHPFLEVATDEKPDPNTLAHHDRWILSELNSTTKRMNESIDEYRFDDACSAIYSFVYDKFCSWYIELSKNILNSENIKAKEKRASVLKYTFREILKLLHPFIPFMSEELWTYVKDENEGFLMLQDYPEYNLSWFFEEDEHNMEKFCELTTGIRNLRNSVNLKPKEVIDVRFFTDDSRLAEYFYSNRFYFKDLAKVQSGTIRDKKAKRPKKSIMMATGHTEVYIPLEGLIDIESQVAKLKKDIQKTEAEYSKVEKKLSNDKFLNNAPAEVVAEVKQRAAEFEEKLESLNLSLKNFS